jgi:hypothetical protein
LAADSLIVLPADSGESLAESAAAEALLNLLNSAVPSNSGFDEAVFFTTSVNEEEHAKYIRMKTRQTHARTLTVN